MEEFNEDSDSSDLDRYFNEGIKKFKTNYALNAEVSFESDESLLNSCINESIEQARSLKSDLYGPDGNDNSMGVWLNTQQPEIVEQNGSSTSFSGPRKFSLTSAKALSDRLDKMLHQCNVIAANKKTQKQKVKRKRAAKKTKSKPATLSKLEVSTDDEVLEVKEEVNPVVSVKILWKSIEYKLFKVRKFDKLQVIFDYFVKTYKLDEKLLLFTIDDKEVDLRSNTFMSLQLQPNQIIEGGVLPEECSSRTVSDNRKKTDGIKFKVQCFNSKSFHIFIKPENNMDVVYSQVIKETDLSIDKFKIQFDGETVKHTDTIETLGLEEGDLFDVTLL